MEQKIYFQPAMVLFLLLTFGVSGCFLGGKSKEVRLSAIRHFQKGNVAFEQRDYQEAILSYHKAIELDSQSAEFHYNLGLAYYSVEHYKHALTSFENAAKLAPDMAETYYNAALVYNKLYDSDKAHKFYKRYQDLMLKRRETLLQKQQTPIPKAAQDSSKAPKNPRGHAVAAQAHSPSPRPALPAQAPKKNISPIPRPRGGSKLGFQKP